MIAGSFNFQNVSHQQISRDLKSEHKTPKENEDKDKERRPSGSSKKVKKSKHQRSSWTTKNYAQF